MALNTYVVYCHQNTINNKIYIGITCRKPEYRWGLNGNNYASHRAFGSAIKKYGWDNFSHTILESNLTKEEALQKEIEYISLYKSNDRRYGYNMTSGGETAVGNHLKRTPEQIEKHRQSLLGTHLTEETKSKISNSLKGKKKSGHTAWNKGTGRKVIQISKSGEIINEYLSAKSAEMETGIFIYRVLRGERKTAGGYIWKYKEAA